MNKENLKLQSYIFRSHLIIIISLTLLLGGTGIFISLRADSRQRDLNLQNVAESIALSRVVENAVSGISSEGLEESLDTLTESLADIDVISVVGKDNIRLYHSNHSLIGLAFDGALPDFSGSEKVYTVSDTGPSGPQRRAYAAICGEDGSPQGFVMAIMLLSSIQRKTARTLLTFAVIILLTVITEFIISYIVSGNIRKRLMGYEPDAFSAMYQIRDNTLETLDEGIIAVDNNAGLQFMNKAAAEMLKGNAGEQEENSGASGSYSEEFGRKLFGNALGSGSKELAVPINAVPGTDILIDRIPVLGDGKVLGAIGILHDRTEYTRLAEDLAGTRFLVDSMRANNHDFTNKLHVIMGLLQMQMYDKAMEYIEHITIVQKETISEIMHAVDLPGLAALLIGKTARASELNTRLIFQKDSRCSKDDLYIPEDVLVTIVGNLIDNALDAINMSGDKTGEAGEIYVGIYSSPDALLINVDDNGPGISEENLSRIFENGFSTKGSGRGVGLYQIKQTIEALGGTISVDSQEGAGASFSVSFTK